MSNAAATAGEAPLLADRSPLRLALKISLWYALIGALWILFSGWVLHHTVSDPTRAAWIEDLKGWFFVLVTASLLGWTLERYFREIRDSGLKLQESDQRWQFALEGAGHGVWDWNVETNEVFYSPRWKAMLGFEPHEIGRSPTEWEKRVHPDDLARVQAEVQRHLTGDSSEYVSEHRMRCKDGHFVWILDRGKVMRRTVDGKPLRFLGTHSDITALKDAQIALQEGEQRLRLALDAARMGTFDWDITRGTVSWSRWHEQLWGLKAGEFDGTYAAFLRGVHPDDREGVQKQVNHCMASQSPFRHEFRVVWPDGSTHWIATAGECTFGLDGRPERMRGTVTEITERRQAERLQALSAEVLRILNDSQAVPNAARRILSAVKSELDFDAVGIRLQRNGDYPYSDSEGFLLAENSLTFRAPEGGFCRDENGKALLECTCGLVLSGQTDPANPMFTTGGSAWTNAAQTLLEAPPGQDPRWHARNRCILEGYESVALIPIRVHGANAGLLQLNDRRKNRFTTESMRFLEGIAASFGVALSRLREEQALRESEAKWRSYIENAAVGVLVTDSAGLNVEANRTAEEILGYEPGKLIETRLVDLFAGPHMDLARARLEAIKADGRAEWQCSLRRQDDRLIWASMRASRLPDGKILAVLQDITERRQAEEALRISEERLRLASEAAQMGAWDRDVKSGRLYWSAEQERLMGFSPGTFPGTNEAFMELLHPDSLAAHASAQYRARSEDGKFQAELHFRCHDGRERWGIVRGRTYFDKDGKPERIIGVDIDITERKRAEEQLRQLSRAVEQSPAVIVITDTSGRIEYINPKFTQTTGYTLDEIRGMTPSVLKSGQMPAEHYRLLWETIRAGKEWHGEFHNRKRNGDLYWERASISPITDPSGKITHFVAVKEDITERKELEAQLRQAQKLEAVGQLAGGVAHDFNNILAAIMMHIGLLQLNPGLDEEVRLGLKDLEAGARRAANLIRQLLMFSRRSVLSMKPVDVNEVVANLLKMLRRLIGEHIDLQFDGDAGLPLVEADTGLLEQVLMNLVVNARDAMPKGGRISIRTAHEHLSTASSSAKPERRAGHFVSLAVSDTGYGMDAATLKRVFEPFFTTKEPGKGTGLGLATVHGIMAQHKGWVEVESVVGQGSIFTAYLPVQIQSPTETQSHLTNEPVRRGGETILIVEDDVKLRQVTGQALRALGYVVLEAGNGREAMTLWQLYGSQVALLVTDIVMPEGMTGLELTEQLQAIKPGLKAIVSSGYSAEIVQAGLPTRTGVVYLPKPFEASQLARVVRTCLDQDA